MTKPVDVEGLRAIVAMADAGDVDAYDAEQELVHSVPGLLDELTCLRAIVQESMSHVLPALDREARIMQEHLSNEAALRTQLADANADRDTLRVKVYRLEMVSAPLEMLRAAEARAVAAEAKLARAYSECGAHVERARAEVARLRAERPMLIQQGFDIAYDNAEVSEHDGWHRVGPFIEWGVARKALDAALVTDTTKEGSGSHE